jgi:hypothetical protein
MVMSKINWDITGTGGQSVIDEGGSKRCQLTAMKQMLWNGRNNLTNSEIISDVKLSSSGNGGLSLRSDASGNNCYRVRINYGAPRVYYVDKVVAGVATVLATVVSSQSWNIYVKTRFRVDGWQLSVEEWIGSTWVLLTTIEETSHQIASGYAGLLGLSAVGYYILFDNVAISERP